MTADPLIDRAKAFLAAISAGAPADIVAEFLAPGVRQDELRKSLLPDQPAREFLALRDHHAGARTVVTTHDFDVTNAVAFLLSPRSSGINAQGLVIDAGMSTNYFDQALIRRN